MVEEACRTRRDIDVPVSDRVKGAGEYGGAQSSLLVVLDAAGAMVIQREYGVAMSSRLPEA